MFKNAIPSDVQAFVKVEAASEDAPPINMMQPEFMRRMSDISQMGGMDYMAGMGRSYTILVNSNHELITGLVDSSDEEKIKTL